MPEYSILVVDNDPDLLLAAEEQVANLNRELGSKQTSVVLTTASSVSEAIRAISTRYHHLAIVDLKLDRNFDSGLEVIQTLIAKAPSCRRLAITRMARSDPLGVLRVVDAHERLVDGVIQKQNQGSENGLFFDIIGEHIQANPLPAVLFDGLDAIVDSVKRSRRMWRDTERTADAIEAEVVSVLCRLFGGRLPTLGNVGATTLKMFHEDQGLSGAVSMSVVPVVSLEPPRNGNRCFVKVGPREAIVREADRFRDRVQLNLPLARRVELLGLVSGDYVAAVAYSFAGGDTGKVTSLNNVALSQGIASQPVLTVIDKLFDPTNSNWYNFAGPSRSLGNYFQSELNSLFTQRLVMLRNSIKRIANLVEGQFDPEHSTLTIADRQKGKDGRFSLIVPADKDFGVGFSMREIPTCLLHGDMHGANILVGASEMDPYLIDFAHAGFGPRSFDAACLHGSVRMWHALALAGTVGAINERNEVLPDAPFLGELESISQKERNVALRWTAKTRKELPRQQQSWEQVSVRIDGLIRRNFTDISPAEVLWVYLYHAARMSTLPIGDVGVLRMLAWYTGLKSAIEQTSQKVDGAG